MGPQNLPERLAAVRESHRHGPPAVPAGVSTRSHSSPSARRQPPEVLARRPRWASATSARVTCRRRWRRLRRCGSGASPGTSSAACRPTRRAPWRSSSPGCTRVDRLKIAERLVRAAPVPRPAAERVPAGEPRRRGQQGRRHAGASCRRWPPRWRALPRLKLRGLMCLPPEESDPARQRAWFAQLRALLRGAQRAAAPGSTRCRWA